MIRPFHLPSYMSWSSDIVSLPVAQPRAPLHSTSMQLPHYSDLATWHTNQQQIQECCCPSVSHFLQHSMHIPTIPHQQHTHNMALGAYLKLGITPAAPKRVTLAISWCGFCRCANVLQHPGGAAHVSVSDEGSASAEVLPAAGGVAGGCGHPRGQRHSLLWR